MMRSGPRVIPTGYVVTDTWLNLNGINYQHPIEDWEQEYDIFQFWLVTGEQLPWTPSLSLRRTYTPNRDLNPVQALPGSQSRSTDSETNSTISDAHPRSLLPRTLVSRIERSGVSVSGPDFNGEYDPNIRRGNQFPTEHVKLTLTSTLTNIWKWDFLSLVRDILHIRGAPPITQYADTQALCRPNALPSFVSTDPGPSQKQIGDGTRKRGTKRKRGEFPYACPFHKVLGARFGIRYGKDGHDRFKACQGPGWTEVRHLADHIRDVHMRDQCLRCWKTFNTHAEWEAHVYRTPRVDCPDLSTEVDRIESVSFEVYQKIKSILSTKRGANASNPSETEKWYLVKKELFPPAKYSHLLDPKHPYYQDPDGIPIDPLPEEEAKLRQFMKSRLTTRLDQERQRSQGAINDLSQLTLSAAEVEELAVEGFSFVTRMRGQLDYTTASHGSTSMASSTFSSGLEKGRISSDFTSDSQSVQREWLSTESLNPFDIGCNFEQLEGINDFEDTFVIDQGGNVGGE